MFNWFWKSLIILAVIAGLAGAWLGWENREAGIRLTAWLRDDLHTWVVHAQECHSPTPQHPPAPASCTPPVDHIPPPPPPPGWDE